MARNPISSKNCENRVETESIAINAVTEGAMLLRHIFAGIVLTACTATSAVAAPSGRVQLVNANSNLCLSPAGGTSNRNEQTVQYHCDTDPSRAWDILPIEGNIVKIRNVKSGLCLTIAGGGSERNTPSVQYPCDEDPSRRWVYAPFDNGLFRLVNVASGLCLTIAGGATGLNDVAVQYPCDADRSRFFRLQ